MFCKPLFWQWPYCWQCRRLHFIRSNLAAGKAATRRFASLTERQREIVQGHRCRCWKPAAGLIRISTRPCWAVSRGAPPVQPGASSKAVPSREHWHIACRMHAKNIDRLENLGNLPAQIINKHVALQVQAEHYPIVGARLPRAILRGAGAEIATG